MPASPELDETLTLHGLDRFVARKKIVERLEAAGLLVKVEPHTHTVPHGDRSGVVIEPYLTDQWYVDAKTLAEPAIAAVRDGRTVFVPKNWEKTYFEWMGNIEPWCISRQLWWGHRIPAWYGPDGKVFVAETEDEAVSRALAHYAETEAITPMQGHDMALDPDEPRAFLIRDEDVLDTWFSSALWPFSTLGWPDADARARALLPDRRPGHRLRHHLLLGRPDDDDGPALHGRGAVPTVYIHALIRDEKGAKMSKSKGNVIDPLELIDDYGADALRFTLAAMAAQGRDIKLSTSRIEGYRNFATKLWNAAASPDERLRHAARASTRTTRRRPSTAGSRGETARTARAVTEALEACGFDEAASALYRFVWNVFCDWYLELAKPVLIGADSAAKAETRAMAAWVLDLILKLLHPFMPFITEELWAVTAEGGVARDDCLTLRHGRC